MRQMAKNISLFGILFFLAIGIVDAQVIEQKTLSLEGAKRVMEGAKNFASGIKAPGGTIAIVDASGHLILVERLDGTFSTGAANISIGKAQTAALSNKPNQVIEDPINKGRTTIVAQPNFTQFQRGIPIVVDGRIIGAIGVAGAASVKQDEEIAIAGAKSLNTLKMATDNQDDKTFGRTESLNVSKMVAATKAKTASYFDGNIVSDSFIDDRKFLDESFGQNYKVEKSLRVWGSRSVIHQDDTDIIYVKQGTATFVTGGDSIYLQQDESNEYSGKGIKNGTIHFLNKGDVVVVPKNMPHWFKEVSEMFRYHVVKVR